jgi:carbamoylphosphate synthase large subunit
MQQKVIVLGGNYDQVPLLQELRERGYVTVLIDYYKEPQGKAYADVHYQESTLDIDQVCAIVEKERPAFVTSLGNDLVVPIIAEVSERFGLPSFQSLENAVKATNKRLMKAAFKEFGISTSNVCDNIDTEGDMAANLRYPLVGKQLVGYGARGVRRINDPAELKAYVGEFGKDGQILVEEFTEGGFEISVDCMVVAGVSTVLMVSRLHQVPGLRQEFSVLLVEFPYALPAAERGILEHMASRMATGFGLENGPFFFQAKVKDGAVSVIEMGARIAGGRKFNFIRRITGFDPLKAQIDLLEGRAVDVRVAATEHYYITAMLYAKPGVIEALKAPADVEVDDLFLLKSAGNVSQGTGTVSDRTAVLTVKGHDRADAQRKLHEAMDQFKVLDEKGNDILKRELYPQQW